MGFGSEQNEVSASQRLYLRSRNTISKFRPWWFVISTMDKNMWVLREIVTIGLSRKCSLTRDLTGMKTPSQKCLGEDDPPPEFIASAKAPEAEHVWGVLEVRILKAARVKERGAGDGLTEIRGSHVMCL